MNILCDTHVLLWFLDGQTRRFPAETLGLLMDEGNTLHYSDASIWEIAIKYLCRCRSGCDTSWKP